MAGQGGTAFQKSTANEGAAVKEAVPQTFCSHDRIADFPANSGLSVIRLILRWFRFGRAIGPSVGSPIVHTGFGIVQDGLPASHIR
jgi:hypothetical protein